MSGIFISYSQNDRDWVKRLVDALTAEGYEVWWDLNIRAGESFDELIESKLENASCVVGVWSKSSVNSEWVRAESAWAKREKKLVSVRIEDELELPIEFFHVHTDNFAGWDGFRKAPEFRKLVSDIQELAIPRASAPKPQEESKSPPTEDEAKRKAEFVKPVLGIMLTWAIGGVIGFYISGTIGFFHGAAIAATIGWTMTEPIIFALGAAIGGTIGGGVTGYVLKRTEQALSFQHVVAITLGWAIGGAIGGAVFGAIGMDIGGAVFGAIGGVVTASVLNRAKPSLAVQQIGEITLGWALGWAVGWAVSWSMSSAMGNDVDMAISWTIGGAVGWAVGGGIGGGIMFWLLRRIHTNGQRSFQT